MERCPPHQLLKKTKPSQEKTQISSFSNGRNADRVETRETLPRDSLGGVLERASAMRRTPQRGDQRALTRGKTQSEARCSKYGNAEKRRRPGTFSGCFDSVRSKSARRDENGEPSRRLGCPQELLKRAKTQNEHRLRRYATHTPGRGGVLSRRILRKQNEKRRTHDERTTNAQRSSATAPSSRRNAERVETFQLRDAHARGGQSALMGGKTHEHGGKREILRERNDSNEKSRRSKERAKIKCKTFSRCGESAESMRPSLRRRWRSPETRRRAPGGRPVNLSTCQRERSRCSLQITALHDTMPSAVSSSSSSVRAHVLSGPAGPACATCAESAAHMKTSPLHSVIVRRGNACPATWRPTLNQWDSRRFSPRSSRPRALGPRARVPTPSHTCAALRNDNRTIVT